MFILNEQDLKLARLVVHQVFRTETARKIKSESDDSCLLAAILVLNHFRTKSEMTERNYQIYRSRMNKGLDIKELADEYNLSVNSVRKICDEIHLKLTSTYSSGDYGMLIAKGISEGDNLDARFGEIYELAEEDLGMTFGIEYNDYSLNPLDELDLTPRAYNCLRRVGISLIGELKSYLESHESLKSLRGMGKTLSDEVMDKLNKYEAQKWR